MKNLLLIAVVFCSLFTALNPASAQNTVFTYQGRMTDNGTNFTGTGQFQFALVTSTNNNHTATGTAVVSALPPNAISSFNIINSGSGYGTAPAVTISGGGGSGATATATLGNGTASGIIVGINLSSGGSGYTSAPAVTIAPPPPNITYTTYWSNDGTSSAGSEPAAAVNVAVTNGLFTVVFGDTTLAGMAGIPVSLLTQPNLQLRIWFNDGTHGFAVLDPVQNLTPTPYAVYSANAGNAGSVAAANIVGTIPVTQLSVSVITNGATGVNLTGSFSGNGGGLTNLNAAQLTGSSPAMPPIGGAPVLNMVWIPPGTFNMGSPASDPDHQANESPQTVVTLTNGFWMGHHPVTQGEYLAVMGSNPSHFTGDLSLPVETVSWLDATNFCNALTLREQSAGRLPAGYVYRLPTEAEWEYGCRALTTTRFYYGNDPGAGTSSGSLTNYAWFLSNSGNTTHPVGQLLANPWGLVDMIGNVSEWCLDLYGTYPGGSVINPLGATTGSPRVIRGAYWNSYESQCRSAARGNNYPAYKLFYDYYNGTSGVLGFRVVLATAVIPYTSTYNVSPIVLTCASNITIIASTPNGTNVYFTTSAYGGCSSPLNLSSSPPSGSTFPLGTTTVTTTASDNCGQTTNCTFIITVNPRTYPPIVLTCSSNLTITASTPNGTNVYFTTSAYGGCSSPLNLSSSPPSGSTFPLGTTTVTTTASDNCGNSTNCNFTVKIQVSPIILTCSTNINVMHSSPNGTTVFFSVTANGGCGTPTVSANPPSGSHFNFGTTTVNATASDICGGTNTCSFTVTVY